MEPLLTTEEVADFLRVDVVTVRRLINRGGLPAYRVGSEFRFSRADLEEFLRRQRTPGGESTMETDQRFDNFTERAKHVIQLARDEARHFNHAYIGTEHLLLGLIREGEGVAGKVLQRLGVELDSAHHQVQVIIGRSDSVAKDTPNLTARAKKVIELAKDEAARLNHRFIGTEHLLLGIIREGEGVACQVLATLGIDLAQVRVNTITTLGARTISPSQAGRRPPPPVPTESATLVPNDVVATTCPTCSAPNLPYFHFCFNCGALLNIA